jgi:uncharacterized repeat protein (TIGR03803 family)
MQLWHFLRTVLSASFIFLAGMPAQSQTYSVLYTFTGQGDGAGPRGASLTMDRAGNLYGGTVVLGYRGGQCANDGCGTIFKMGRRPSGWTFSTLYQFHGDDGVRPEQILAFAPDGALYGTTQSGGQYRDGVVFRLQPPANPCRSGACY